MIKDVAWYIEQSIAISILLNMIFIPLGIWKLIELIEWAIKHISIQIV
jgi:hypothetical protein